MSLRYIYFHWVSSHTFHEEWRPIISLFNVMKLNRIMNSLSQFEYKFHHLLCQLVFKQWYSVNKTVFHSPLHQQSHIIRLGLCDVPPTMTTTTTPRLLLGIRPWTDERRGIRGGYDNGKFIRVFGPTKVRVFSLQCHPLPFSLINSKCQNRV